MAQVLQVVINGILLGGIYALLGVGMTMMFGIVKLTNLAHGEFVIIGSYASTLIAQAIGVDPILTLVVTVPLMFLIGMGLQSGLINRVMMIGSEPALLVTFGLSIILADALLLLFSADAQRANVPYNISSIKISAGLSISVLDLIVFFIALLCTLTWPLIVTMFGTPSFGDIVGNYVAMFLVIGALISIGLLISSLTENQIIAAILSFVILIATYYFGEIASAVDSPIVSTVLNWLSIFSRYDNFTNGIFSLADVVYYISIMVVFLFLTTRVIEKRRWA